MALWTPAQITTQLWFDGADESSVATTGTTLRVTQWDDKSGNARHATQSDSTRRPRYCRGLLNGLGAMQFFNTTEMGYLDIANGKGIARDVGILWIYASASPQPLGSDPALPRYAIMWQGGTSASSTRAALRIGGNSGRWEYRRLDADTDTQVNFGTVEFKTRVWGKIYDFAGGTLAGYIDGAEHTEAMAGTPANTSDTDSLAVRIGSQGTGGSFYGMIGEILVGTGALTTANRQRIEGYLAHKWGTQALLSATHPYRYFAPRTTHHYIRGVVRGTDGQPAQRKVYAVTRPTDTALPQVLAHALSDAVTGAYELAVPDDTEVSRIVVSEDNAPLLNDILHRIVPGVDP
jgi:hypothetical protein